MLKLAAPVVLLIVCVAAFVAWDPPMPRADVTLVNRGEVSTLDPATMSWGQDFRIARLISEGLVRQDVFTKEMEPRPGVAERWEIEENGRLLRFHLRADARWTDGSPVTAHDFAYAWRRNLLPETGADYATLFKLLDGGAEFFEFRKAQLKAYRAGEHSAAGAERMWAEAEARFAESVGVTAVSDRELVVRLARPTPYILDVLAFPAFFPVHRRTIEAFTTLDTETGEVRVDPRWTRPPGFVANGPFALVDWRFKRGMRFERNPLYWDGARINVDSIDCPTIEDSSAQVLAFRTGSADWVFDISAPYRDEMLARRNTFWAAHADEVRALRAKGADDITIARALPRDPDGFLHVFPAFGTYFYNINCSPTLPDGRTNPLADARVRRALALTVNKRAIVLDLRRCGEREAATLIPPGSIEGYDSPQGLGHNPDEARRLMEEAGYAGGRGFPSLEILFNKDGGHDLIAQSVAKDWERELGISVRLVVKETKVFREDLKQARYMISRASWFGDYGDPTTFLDVNRSDDNNNDRRYAKVEFDALMDQAADEYGDPAARMRTLSQAEGMIVGEDLPLIPLFHYVELHLFDARRIAGATPHPRQVQDLTYLDVLGDGKGRETPPEMER
ncbi:MAG: peptide ABC transporter substrate-binding protein [Phycisphaerales bacterium]